VVTDGDRLVGTAAGMTLRLATPGADLALCGVSEAAVLPSHRRRGILSALLATLHDDAEARGEPVAGLTASEGGIYRRFGYGVAARYQSLVLDATRAAEVAPLVAPEGGGAVRVMGQAEAAEVLPAVWERHWRRRPGEVRRTPGMWLEDGLDPPARRGGASARFVAVHHDRGGAPDGFLVYRIAQDFGAGGTRHELRIESLAAASDTVEAALMRFAADVDLVATVTWHAAPTDLGLRWRLADPRAVLVKAERDHLWLRPLDVAACLVGRRYGAAGGLVIEVVDDRRPAEGGHFSLEAAPGGEAACDRTDRPAEVAVRTADLGALLLGGVTWTALGRAGLADERTPGALAWADALFRPERAPYCGTDF
jgi:predicted acetyltransferase